MIPFSKKATAMICIVVVAVFFLIVKGLEQLGLL